MHSVRSDRHALSGDGPFNGRGRQAPHEADPGAPAGQQGNRAADDDGDLKGGSQCRQHGAVEAQRRIQSPAQCAQVDGGSG